MTAELNAARSALNESLVNAMALKCSRWSSMPPPDVIQEAGPDSRRAAAAERDRKVENPITCKDARNHVVAQAFGYHPGYRCIRDLDRERIVCT